MKKKNFKPFFPLGICFIGAGVTFIAAVNRGLGISFIGLGIIWMVLAIKNQDKRKK